MRHHGLVLVLTLSFALLGAAPPKPERTDASEREFCRLDKNSDRAITFEEFAACEFYKLEHVRALPFAQPKDTGPGVGRLSDEDLKSRLFDQADKNRDRRIDRKEWEEFYESVKDPAR